MIDGETLKKWTDQARRDDWHRTFVGSDIRQMLGEIERLRLSLDEVANPLKYMEQRAKSKGHELNAAAPGICDNVNYVKQIARDALADRH